MRLTRALMTATLAAAATLGLAAQHQVKPDTLPKPFATPDVRNPPTVVPQPAGASLTLPEGFSAKLFAEGGFKRMRWIAVAPGGDVFATDSDAHTLTVLRDTDGDGAADERHAFAEGLARPFGIAFGAGHVYVANAGSVVRWPYRAGQTKAEGAPQTVVQMPAQPGHWTRTLAFSPDGERLYVTIGSSSDAGAPDADRALIFSVRPDGSDRQVLATGLRNPIGIAFRPGSGQLWAAVQERDKLGDDLVPDYITSVRKDGFYGWPFAYAGPNEDPRHAGERPDLVKQAVVPDLLLEAHSAVMGLVFYEGSSFPAAYRGHAFATLRGSSNRSVRTGYKVIRIPFANGKASGRYEDFATGWMLGEDKKEVWGRPVGIAVAGDGALLVADDANQRVWRIAYGGSS
jgi:glucose/arabinose dehydrogenase